MKAKKDVFQFHIRLDDDNHEFVKKFQEKNNLKTMNETLNLIIKNYSLSIATLEEIKQIHHDLMLQRKYLNELRKNEFIILDLLNAITYASDLHLPVNHNNKDFQSIAFQNALNNYREYMEEIQTKIAENKV